MDTTHMLVRALDAVHTYLTEPVGSPVQEVALLDLLQAFTTLDRELALGAPLPDRWSTPVVAEAFRHSDMSEPPGESASGESAPWLVVFRAAGGRAVAASYYLGANGLAWVEQRARKTLEVFMSPLVQDVVVRRAGSRGAPDVVIRNRRFDQLLTELTAIREREA